MLIRRNCELLGMLARQRTTTCKKDIIFWPERYWSVKQQDDIAEHLGSTFTMPCTKAGARALLNEMQELSATFIKL